MRPLRNRSILIVEDNEADIQLIREAFQEAGNHHSMVFVRSGREALIHALSTCASDSALCDGRSPCLIILDFSIPDMSGEEVLQELRKHKATRRIPIVVLSASEKAEDVVSAYKLGANSFICKTYSRQKFIEKIKYLYLYWLDVVQLPVA
ncbi:MAG TPA: response regulator [Coleofasciculaceae cyanobacterium]|jgi:two-component system response regulator